MYDLIILGGGPAGYRAAERAGAAGMKTALIEKRALGGVCLNEGCIPSKTLLHSAKLLHHAHGSARFGVTTTGAQADPAAIVRRKDIVVKKLVAGVSAQMKRYGVEVIAAEGKSAARTDDGFSITAGDERLTARRLLIATGSAPLIPPIPGVREGVASGGIWTSREALDAAILPERLIIVGGGVIGMEMASYFSAMGSKVSVIEMLPAIGGPIDPALAQALLKSCRDIDFHLGSRVTSVQQQGDVQRVCFERGGEQHVLEADRVLLCIGRRPETAGLEALGLHMEKGAVAADASGRTSLPDAYAAGDVNGRSMLAHTAYREAECAVATMLGQTQAVDYDAIPSVIYTQPEIAAVGLTLDQAKTRGYDAKAVTLPLAYAGRYVAESLESDGFCTLVADAASRRVLGFHMMGPYASEIIYGAAMMVSLKLPIETLRRQVFPHPTVSEILYEALWAI